MVSSTLDGELMATVRTAPGRLPGLGHTLPLLRGRMEFTGSLCQYGDVVKIYLGPLPCYVVNDKDLVRQVLVTEAGKFQRGRIFDRIRPFLGNGLVTSDGRPHLRNRRLMQPAFHRSQIAGYVEGMARVITEIVGTWQPGQCRAIDHDMQVVAGTIVGDALFSASLDRAELDAMLRDVNLLIGQSTARAMSPAMLSRLPLPVNRRYDRAVDHVHRTVSEVVRARRGHRDDHGDLLSMLLAARHEDTGDGLADEEIHDEVLTLFAAGAETTARALAWFFHELGQRPDIERRVVAEIDEVLGGQPVTVEHLPRLTYTRQVFDEVLRHYAVWLLMRRPVTDVDLGGVQLAAGTELIISPHALRRLVHSSVPVALLCAIRHSVRCAYPEFVFRPAELAVEP